jgi:hypothetical protein
LAVARDAKGGRIFGKDEDKLATHKRAVQIIDRCAQNFGIIK